MNTRCARLEKEWLLRGWTDVPWLWLTEKPVFFENWTRTVLSLLNMRRSGGFQSMAFCPAHRVLNRFIAEGIAETCSAEKR